MPDLENSFDPDLLTTVEPDFFMDESTEIAPQLLGCYLISEIDGMTTAIRITETEAYPGTDPASHAYLQEIPTERTSIHYSTGGPLYIYLVMGLHIMTSVVVNKKGLSDVVFIRSGEPVLGQDIMKARRGIEDTRLLTNGPGKLSQALGIGREHNGILIHQANSTIRIQRPTTMPELQIGTGPRINLGVSKARTPHEAQLAIERPWRFFIDGSEYLSR